MAMEHVSYSFGQIFSSDILTWNNFAIKSFNYDNIVTYFNAKLLLHNEIVLKAIGTFSRASQTHFLSTY